MDPKNIKKEYSNGEVTIVWQSGLCIHSTKCWKGHAGLPEVFNPAEKPWIKPEGANTERIIAQVKQCPSGALSYYLNTKKNEKEEVVSSEH
ncbi:MAG: (4Fe-4S)-binding protein, partial [Bacteroidia bacterium]|nr:(4Fe-4S)-binding protein [Bacteroidia bacterium]